MDFFYNKLFIRYGNKEYERTLKMIISPEKPLVEVNFFEYSILSIVFSCIFNLTRNTIIVINNTPLQEG